MRPKFYSNGTRRQITIAQLETMRQCVMQVIMCGTIPEQTRALMISQFNKLFDVQTTIIKNGESVDVSPWLNYMQHHPLFMGRDIVL